jgi:hypothetical protein
MTDYIESIVGNEGKILIEVSPSRSKVGFGAKTSETEGKTTMDNAFNHALHTIRLAAGSVLETLNTLPERPDNAQISFAIKFDPDVGAMIAEAESKAQLRVSLSWQTDKSKKEAEKDSKDE